MKINLLECKLEKLLFHILRKKNLYLKKELKFYLYSLLMKLKNIVITMKKIQKENMLTFLKKNIKI